MIEELKPDGVSVAIQELFADAADEEAAARFLARLRGADTLLQYSLYDANDVRRYHALLADGAVPAGRHMVLFVLGRYSNTGAEPSDLGPMLAAHGDGPAWMACAFGPLAPAALVAGAQRGGHIRIGFENGWLLADGGVAADNAELVRDMVALAGADGRPVADADTARALF